MRRGVGMGGLQSQQNMKRMLAAKGVEREQIKIEYMQEQLKQFRESLAAFASKYRERIRKNPEFRQRFQQLCGQIGVDPLASNKGFWSELLGIGNFYYDLGIQAIEICLATRDANGGLMTLAELRTRLDRRRAGSMRAVSEYAAASAILPPLPIPPSATTAAAARARS